MYRSVACCALLCVSALALVTWFPSGKSGANPAVYTAVSLASGSHSMSVSEPLLDEASSVQKVRKALDESIEVDFIQTPLTEAIDTLQGKLKINIAIDQTFMMNGAEMVTLRLEKAKGRVVLEGMLSRFKLTYTILGDSIFVGS